ncbi:hypothetical protein BDM02DRAFT_3187774 [Thelephora ganbajun]|uniref:Uncharacterized protein n=1 Tax=Thelephora ganbajun TaxID=370292 RepID=A0ACB6ZE80_THEGA|nr:hypothetical protein BDM02DRAFT_3187774 [Thelephora ganbajun]
MQYGTSGPPPSPSFPHHRLKNSEDHVPAYHERTREGKVIRVQDVAFLIFQAFLLYLYTDDIEFASFGSKTNRKTRAAEIVSLAPNCVPRPSPKSIYRLADKYGVPALKSIALREIKEALGQCDAIQETFGRFASHYPEMLRMHVENLASILTKVDSGEAQGQLNERLQAFVEGEIDHTSEAFSSLWRTLTSTAPPRSPKSIYVLENLLGIQPLCDSAFANIKNKLSLDNVVEEVLSWVTAGQEKVMGMQCELLIPNFKNPRTIGVVKENIGHISDRSFSRCGGALKLGLKKAFEQKRQPPGDLWQICLSLPRDTQNARRKLGINPHQSRFGRSAGSTKRETAGFCRGRDRPHLGSILVFVENPDLWGRRDRLNHIQQNTVAATAPPRSPKSIYVLENLLGIQPLCDSAFANIKNKLSLDNVVEEVLSWVTAGQEKVMGMQCELLIPNFKNPRTIGVVKENIGHISDRSFSRCGGALKLGLKKAFEQKRQPPGVLLRCSHTSCVR